MTATLRIGADWPTGVGPQTALLGLPLLRRQVLAAERAGFDRIFVEPVAGADLASLISGTRAQIIPPGAASSDRSVGTARLSGRILPRVAWLRFLREHSSETPSQDDRFEIRGPEDLPRAERWLLDGLVKETEGFMSRHFERKISLAVSRRLAATRVTPNAMTLVSVGVGLAGASFFLSPRPAAQFLGALLFLAHSILDGCDGELARLKFEESRLGGLLDFWGDNFVHCAVFGAIALGWWRASGETAPLLFGAAAIAGTLLSAAFVYLQTMREPHEGPLFASVSRSRESRLSRMADALARRDFIYLAVIFAAFGKVHWFLVLAAVGAPVFFLVLVAIAFSEGSLGRSYS